MLVPAFPLFLLYISPLHARLWDGATTEAVADARPSGYMPVCPHTRHVVCIYYIYIYTFHTSVN